MSVVSEASVSRKTFDQLEQFLRNDPESLCAQAAARFQQAVNRHPGALRSFDMLMTKAGARYAHELIVVAAALYPSDISLRKQYTWAATGMLRREGIDSQHQSLILQAHFDAIREASSLDPEIQTAVNLLEKFMLRVLHESFSSTPEGARH